jgi:hypothetical protein
MGEVKLPHIEPEHLLYYGVLAGLAAFELLELPMAIVLAMAKLLADQHRSRILRDVGRDMESTL